MLFNWFLSDRLTSIYVSVKLIYTACKNRDYIVQLLIFCNQCKRFTRNLVGIEFSSSLTKEQKYYQHI